MPCVRPHRLPLAGLALALAACGEGARETLPDEFLRTGKKLYSQGNEELIVRHFFGDRTGGVFVDVGCADFRLMSTTFYLEQHLGWSGIGVDALPEYAPGYRQHRPRTRFCNYIVTDHAGTSEPFFRVERMRELSSTSEKYAGRMARGDYEVLQVPTITLTELLEQQGIDSIDFLSMDIENAEPAALAGFDIERFSPELVCIEAHKPVRARLLNYFTGHHYRRLEEYDEFDTLNWYFTPE